MENASKTPFEVRSVSRVQAAQEVYGGTRVDSSRWQGFQANDFSYPSVRLQKEQFPFIDRAENLTE